MYNNLPNLQTDKSKYILGSEVRKVACKVAFKSENNVRRTLTKQTSIYTIFIMKKFVCKV